MCSVHSVTAQFSDNQILILIPESDAIDWTTTDRVGIEATQDVGENTELYILMEKDFECTSRPEDPDRRAGPHTRQPPGAAGRPRRALGARHRWARDVQPVRRGGALDRW